MSSRETFSNNFDASGHMPAARIAESTGITPVFPLGTFPGHAEFIVPVEHLDNFFTQMWKVTPPVQWHVSTSPLDTDLEKAYYGLVAAWHEHQLVVAA